MATAHQLARRERAEARATRLRARAESAHAAATAEVAQIPMGQPILVGHHSEAKHRRALDRHDRKMRIAVDTFDAARDAERRVSSAGRSISADDPEALDALRTKLARLEERHLGAKRINAAWKRGGAEGLRAAGVGEKLVTKIESVMRSTPWLDAPLSTKNQSAQIRATKRRIAELEAAAVREPMARIEGPGFTVEEDLADNRVRILFDTRPSRDVCVSLKRAGFRWAPSVGAWQRQATPSATAAAKLWASKMGAVV